jgi:hypothetical protein
VIAAVLPRGFVQQGLSALSQPAARPIILAVRMKPYSLASLETERQGAIFREKGIAVAKRKPIRYTRLHDDGSIKIKSTVRTLERKFGLPEGSVRLVYPSGRRARWDSTVGRLKQRWS